MQVRIADNAVVAAARLSQRYIPARFLPDKAIDLLDEACAVVRVELDSEPAILDDVKRRRLQLEVEAAALRAEEGLAPALLFDDQSVLYTPAREHESPAHQRRRTKRFRMRKKQVLAKFAQHFRSISESALLGLLRIN